MKYFTMLFLVLFSLAACKNNSKEASETPGTEVVNAESETVVGGDLDENGCKGSAGETWSQLLEECIRPFELAERLNPVGATSDSGAIMSAFALLNAEEDKAEIYMADVDGSVVLEQATDSTYGGPALEYNRIQRSLSVNGQVLYTGADD